MRMFSTFLLTIWVLYRLTYRLLLKIIQPNRITKMMHMIIVKLVTKDLHLILNNGKRKETQKDNTKK